MFDELLDVTELDLEEVRVVEDIWLDTGDEDFEDEGAELEELELEPDGVIQTVDVVMEELVVPLTAGEELAIVDEADVLALVEDVVTTVGAARNTTLISGKQVSLFSKSPPISP